MGSMLELKGVNVYYGAIHAVKDISLTVNQGEIVTLIGANGAGKSTTLRTISGLLRPKSGSISFEGKEIAGVKAHEIVRQGISQVPEGRRIFAEMTVMENLDMGAFTRKDKDGIRADLKRVFELFPRLEERKSQVAGTLSGGEQQMLAMGRALMSRPWDWRHCSSGKSSISLKTSTGREQRCYWSSRMPIWRFPSPAAPMCWKRGASPCPAMPQNWRRARKCAKPIWAVEKKGIRRILANPFYIRKYCARNGGKYHVCSKSNGQKSRYGHARHLIG